MYFRCYQCGTKEKINSTMYELEEMSGIGMNV